MTHPETLGTLRSGTISWLEVGRESAGSEASKQKCDLVRNKKWRAQGGTEGRVGGQMKDTDRQIQRLKNPIAVFFASFTSAVVLTWSLGNHIGAVFSLNRHGKWWCMYF